MRYGMVVQALFRSAPLWPVLSFVAALGVGLTALGPAGVSSVESSLLIGLVWVLIYRWFKSRGGVVCSKWAMLVGAIFSVLLYLGSGVVRTEAVGFLAPSVKNILSAIIQLVGCWSLLAPASDCLLGRVHILSRPSKVGKLLASKHGALLGAGVLLLAWLPYLVVRFPGTTSWDAAYMLTRGLGYYPMTAHHPPLLSWAYAVLFLPFAEAFGVNAGVLVLVAGQAIVFALCISLSLSWVARTGCQRLALLGLVFFALFPIFPLYATVVVKDAIAAGLMLLFITQVYVLVRWLVGGSSQRRPVLISFPALLLVSAGCCLTRNDSVFCIALTILALVVWQVIRSRGSFNSLFCRMASPGIAIVCSLVLAGIVNGIIFPVLHVEPGNSREALSLPLQQVARCLQEHPDDLEDGERESIEASLVEGASLESVASAYNPYISDAVKSQFDFDSKPGSLVSFLGAWASLGLRHAGTYAASMMEGTLGYWYPFVLAGRTEALPAAHDAPMHPEGVDNRPGIANAWMADWGGYGEYAFPMAVDMLERGLSTLTSLPMLNVFFSPGIYVWALLFTVMALLRRRSAGLIVVLPLLIKFGICCASPLAGSIRYALPIIIGMPVVLACVVRDEQGSRECSDRRIAERLQSATCLQEEADHD